MKKALGALLVLSLFVPLGVQGQEASPELQKLDYWVGEWTSTDSDGSSGKSECKWLGDSFVQCEGDFTDGSMLWVMGYDAEKGTHTVSYFSSDGENGAFDSATLEGDTWTWLVEVPTGGGYRQTFVMESEDVMISKGELTEDGVEWVVQVEDRMTRVK